MISHKDKLFLTKNLSVLVRSGLPLAESLLILKEQTSNSQLKQILGKIVLSVENGASLADAFVKNGHGTFDGFFTSILRMGEQSGSLEKSLEFLAQQLEKDFALKQKVQGALLYPGLILATTTIMGGFISFYILPQLVDFFSNFDLQLPLSTRILLGFANLMKYHGVEILAGIAVIVSLLALMYQIKSIKKLGQNLSLKVPIIGALAHYGLLARMGHNLAVLLKSGIPLNQGLEILGETTTNLYMKEAIERARQEVKKGQPLARGLNLNKGLFLPTLVKMVETGEKTGKLDEVLAYVGGFYEEEVDNVAKNLTTLLEPMLLLGIGLIVAFVALSIIGPIYQLTGSIG